MLLFLPCSDDAIYEGQYLRHPPPPQIQVERSKTSMASLPSCCAAVNLRLHKCDQFSRGFGSTHTPQTSCFVYLFLSIIFSGKKTMQAVTARPPNFYTTRKPFVHIPHICRDASIDAVTQTNDGLTYIFKGKK